MRIITMYFVLAAAGVVDITTNPAVGQIGKKPAPVATESDEALRELVSELRLIQ
jgi:hypothetical protein